MSRLQAWAPESRIRYALVWGGINGGSASAVIVLVRLSEISVGRALSYIALGMALDALSAGLIWYPIAKAEAHDPSRMS